MGRRAFTPEEKIEANKRATVRKYKWVEANKEKFDAYMVSYYNENKERLDARNLELKQQKALIKKEAKKALILQSA
jgi:hypothetical protein